MSMKKFSKICFRNFWTLVRTGSRSTAFQQKNLTLFSKIMEKYDLKLSKSYPKKCKKTWPHFSLLLYFKSTISQKLKIGKLFFFYSFSSIHNPSFMIIKSPLKIIKSKRLFLRGGGPQIIN